jgi:hypothetical protein
MDAGRQQNGCAEDPGKSIEAGVHDEFEVLKVQPQQALRSYLPTKLKRNGENEKDCREAVICGRHRNLLW